MPFTPPLSASEVESAFGGQFKVLNEIASGGQGSVFRVHLTQTVNSPSLALKVYFEDQLEERTEREVEALRSISAPTLVKLHASGNCRIRNERCVYITTSFIEGSTLSALLQKSPLSPFTVIQIAHDIALAIDHLWASRIVHRDIKPNNIILNTDSRAILIDLGLARHLNLDSLTSMGKTWGTEGYLSPEQMEAQRALTCKSDIFSLGIVLQECLLGRHPTGRRQMFLQKGGIATAQLLPGTPEPLATLIDSMMHKSPLKRPMPSAVTQKALSLQQSFNYSK